MPLRQPQVPVGLPLAAHALVVVSAPAVVVAASRLQSRVRRKASAWPSAWMWE